MQSSQDVVCDNKCSKYFLGSDDDCKVSISYGVSSEASIEFNGTMQTDVAVFQDEQKPFSINFECADVVKSADNKDDSHFENGILGLGPAPSGNILYKWFKDKGVTMTKTFSVCLAPNGGYIELGEAKGESFENAVYASFEPYQATYIINEVEGIQMGQLQLMPSQGVKMAFDTGAPHVVFPINIHQSIMTELVQRCAINNKLCKLQKLTKEQKCFTLTKSIIDSYDDQVREIFPDIVFSLKSGKLSLGPN